MKLVSKDALVAEIDRLDALYHTSKSLDGDLFIEGLLSFLDTIEVKEVDIEKELNDWRHNHFHGRRDKEACGEYLERSTQLDIAKHFYSLGLAQKGE